MRTSTVLSVLVATGLAVAAPQSLNDLPACAQTAVQAAIEASGCSFSSVSCICSSLTSDSTLEAYIIKNCPPSDQSSALTDFDTVCAPYGVTESATAPVVSPTAMTPAVESDVAPVTTMAPVGTVTSTINPTDAAMGWTETTWTTSCASTMPTSNSTAALLPYTGAAVSSFEYEIAMVLAGAAGVAAFLV